MSGASGGLTLSLILLVWLVGISVPYYILARAEITKFFWDNVSGIPFLDGLLRCSICSGVWLGMAFSTYVAPPYIGHGSPIERILWGAAFGAMFGPVGTSILVTARNLTAIQDEETEEDVTSNNQTTST